jgi:single-strand DNA-binding protein
MKMKNRVQLIGHIGQDPEIINLDGGKKLAKLRLATNDSYTKADGTRVEDTQWHNLVAWGKSAEIVEKILAKGKQVGIDGKLVNRSYENKEGDKRYVTEVVVNEFVLLDKKPS